MKAFRGHCAKFGAIFGLLLPPGGMPHYHCTLPVEGVPRACGCALLAVADRPGDAPPPEGGELDVLDQAIRFFRANVLFKRFDVRGEGDRTLLYLTFYLSLCMNRLEKARTRAEGERAMAELARESFDRAYAGAVGLEMREQAAMAAMVFPDAPIP